MKYSKTFVVKGSIERCFDIVQDYFQSIKFRVKNRSRPNLLVLKRGSGLGSIMSFSIEKYKTILTIYFSQIEDKVSVLCEYDIDGYLTLILPDMKSTLEAEVEKLKYILETSL